MTALPEQPIAVLGAGSWGTALAIQLARNGQPTLLWGHDPQHLAQINTERCNRRYLPGIDLPDHLTPEPNLHLILEQVRDILIVVPSQAFRSVLEDIVDWHQANDVGLDSDQRRIVWATKGLDPNNGRLLHETAVEIVGKTIPLAVLSGPTFAAEVAAGMPTAITLACRDVDFSAALLARLHDDRFRVYTNDDLIGVGLGGAVKNVLAIAAGIADGLQFGANSRAALVTRGLAEMMRLGVAMGGERETFMGLAGLGDLVLTCTDNQSRNRRLGLALAVGQTVEAAQSAIGQVVEGVTAAREVRHLAEQYGVEMPIVDQVYRVLYQHLPIDEAVVALFSRQPREEQV
jgi:glycerol-3-phosphate dehydrogenase (NAD(P)+)